MEWSGVERSRVPPFGREDGRGRSFAFACNFFGGRGRNLSTCDERAPMSKLPPDADILKMSRALIITLKVTSESAHSS